jgi:kynureninase
MQFENNLAFAQKLDKEDVLKEYRKQFHIPKTKEGKDVIYLCGNSLGLQPITIKSAIEQELEDWKNLGVEGHTQAKNPWMPYHELLTVNMANIVGALPAEVVVMNTLTTNLHLMLVSFYQPTAKKNKVLIDWNPFPSDRYAIASHIKSRGYNAATTIIEPQPKVGTAIITTEQILQIIEEQGAEIALILIGGVNYYSGQVYNMEAITKAAHSKGCMVGFDLAHGAGNLHLQLHNMGCDFAVWCTYKYLNSGPGSLSGCFIHERHHNNKSINRLEGWWGTNKNTRFKMEPNFDAIPTAEAWQLSNPPILSMAAINASLQIFANAGMENLRKKSVQLTGYLLYLLNEKNHSNIEIITPQNEAERGCQISLQIKDKSKHLYNQLTKNGIIADWREPDVIRVAPVPLYNSFEDVWRFVNVLTIIPKGTY